MTEPEPTWFLGNSAVSESDVQRQVVEALEAAGWEVLITSQDIPTRRHTAARARRRVVE